MKPLTALVVDDDKHLARAFALALEQCGFTVTQITDSTRALAEIDSLRPDVVTLDVLMPTLSGIDILQGIRRNPALAHIKVIIITASGAVSYNEIVNELADLVLFKPVSLSQITTFAVRFAEQSRDQGREQDRD